MVTRQRTQIIDNILMFDLIAVFAFAIGLIAYYISMTNPKKKKNDEEIQVLL